MKKMKRILALIGAVLLLSLYLMTLIGALTASENQGALLKASIYSTVVVPVFLYAYMLVYRLLKKTRDKMNTPEE
jgi:NADH:ubiquinone oxidoreductase subunit 6 (subunit J)